MSQRTPLSTEHRCQAGALRHTHADPHWHVRSNQQRGGGTCRPLTSETEIAQSARGPHLSTPHNLASGKWLRRVRLNTKFISSRKSRNANHLGDIAQLVERVLSMHEVQGSIPCVSTIFFGGPGGGRPRAQVPTPLSRRQPVGPLLHAASRGGALRGARRRPRSHPPNPKQPIVDPNLPRPYTC